MCGSLKLLSSTANLLRSLKWTSQSFWTIQAIHQIKACRWTMWFVYFMYFVLLPVIIWKTISKSPFHACNVTPELATAWDRSIATEAAWSKWGFEARRDKPIAGSQLAAVSFFWLHHGFCQCSVQGSELPDTFFSKIQNININVSTSSVHHRFHHRLHALACIHAKRFSVPSDWRRLCSAQAVDFGAFLVHGREHGIWRVPKHRMLMEDADAGCWLTQVKHTSFSQTSNLSSHSWKSLKE